MAGTFPNQPHLSAREAISRAHSMHVEVQELEDTITAQQEEIAWLKGKLLHHKRHSLEKFFMWDDNFAMQAALHEWKHFWHKQRKLREMDGFNSAREMDARAAMQTMAQLQAQLAEMDKAYQELAAKDAQGQEQLAKAEQLVRTVAGATTEYEMETPAKTPQRIEGESTYIKMKLREIIEPQATMVTAAGVPPVTMVSTPGVRPVTMLARETPVIYGR